MEPIYFIGLLAAGQGLFQGFLMATGAKQKYKDQVLLTLILSFLSLSVLEYSLVWSGNIDIFPHLIGFSTIGQFLFLPLIYLFFLISKQGNIKNLFYHFIPALFVSLCLFDFIFLGAEAKLIQMGKVYHYSFLIASFKIPLCLVFCAQCLVYFFLVQSIKNRNSTILGKVLYRIFISYLLVHLVHTTLIYFVPMSLQKIGLGILLLSTASIYLLSYFAYKRTQIIKEEKLPKYFHSSLDKATAVQNIKEFNEFLKKENFFTNSDIRMTDVAKQLNISSQHLSQSINQELKCSFREYLNGLRIEYAKELIDKESNHRVSLKEVAFNSGFNSKTSFSNAFKKKSKMTPSQYVQHFKRMI